MGGSGSIPQLHASPQASQVQATGAAARRNLAQVRLWRMLLPCISFSGFFFHWAFLLVAFLIVAFLFVDFWLLVFWLLIFWLLIFWLLIFLVVEWLSDCCFLIVGFCVCWFLLVWLPLPFLIHFCSRLRTGQIPAASLLWWWPLPLIFGDSKSSQDQPQPLLPWRPHPLTTPRRPPPREPCYLLLLLLLAMSAQARLLLLPEWLAIFLPLDP